MSGLTEIQSKALVRLKQGAVEDSDPRLIPAHRRAFQALAAKGLAELVADPEDDEMQVWVALP
jgi:hypothetical protein